MTLNGFLIARLGEERILVVQSVRDEWRVGHKYSCDWWGDMPGTCTCDATARALADNDAKRRIVEHHHPDRLEPDVCAICSSHAELWPCTTLHLLAMPYADHPDYDEAWRP